MILLEPKKRSKFRLFLGKKYYTFLRYLFWGIHNFEFAKSYSTEDTFTYTFIQHHTPLIRNLKDVMLYLQYNKIDNLNIAISHINNLVLRPGETFSFWRLVGKPSKKKGYKEGIVLESGNLKTGIGGRLCQLTNLIYWMTLHTPLTIAERYRHSYDVFPDSNRTLPFGSGATCVYNYRDLIIKNNTNMNFKLRFWLTEDELYGTILTDRLPIERYEVYEKEHYFNRELFGKYSRHNVIARKVYDLHDNLIYDEIITENHALMIYEPFLENFN